MDFHEASLLRHEAEENFTPAPVAFHTWFVKTADWEQQAISSTELVDLIDEALEEGLTPTIELC